MKVIHGLLLLSFCISTLCQSSLYYDAVKTSAIPGNAAAVNISCANPALVGCVAYSSSGGNSSTFDGADPVCCTDPKNSTASYCSGSGWVCCGCSDSSNCGSCQPGNKCLGTTTCLTNDGFIVLIVVCILVFILMCCCCVGVIYCCCCGCPELCACLLCAWCCCELTEGMI